MERLSSDSESKGHGSDLGLPLDNEPLYKPADEEMIDESKNEPDDFGMDSPESQNEDLGTSLYQQYLNKNREKPQSLIEDKDEEVKEEAEKDDDDMEVDEPTPIQNIETIDPRQQIIEDQKERAERLRKQESTPHMFDEDSRKESFRQESPQIDEYNREPSSDLMGNSGLRKSESQMMYSKTFQREPSDDIRDKDEDKEEPKEVSSF